MRNRQKTSARDFLACTPWVEAIPLSARSRIFEDAYEATFLPGEIVARKGEAALSWIGVMEGLLKLSDVRPSGKLIMFAGIPPGDWIGEGTLFKKELRRYDVVSVCQTRTVNLPASTFRWLLDTSIEFTHVVMARLNERLARFIEMMEIDRMDDPVARVARTIGAFYNPILSPSLNPALTLSQSELGELIGVSRQTIGSALKQLQTQGLVHVCYGKTVVLQPHALRDYEEREAE
ncbi:Transcriptional regulator, Crp/Fnr family [Cupriavidus phytorum]|uniref:Transcriptional regulator, Crp/Fnr family n=2 Tax=Cupriavidus TaxID=106589 RepID=A0A375CIT7_9BURK|nr:CRP-like cAMP-binding protein [Cupriavidus alkaliphilus]SOY71815.1 Transcriptional regulator, Crp/Fnr family [Cupriavidus taiwanensis]